jgi:hypothetical protein
MSRWNHSIGFCGLLFAGFLAVFPGVASAETTLIAAGVNNGDFNDDVSGTDQRVYSDTPAWTNIGTGFDQNQEATRTNLGFDGTRNHAVAEAAGRVAAQDCGHTLGTGDYISFGYYWRDAFNWSDASDQIAIRLFTTDNNTLTGGQSTFATVLSGTSSANDSYQVGYGRAIAPASASGKKLFVAIDTQDGNASANGFARLDQFQLSVTSSPPAGTVFYDSFEYPDISSDADGYSNTDPVGWTGGTGGLNHENCGQFTTPYGGQALWLNGGAAKTTSSILSEVLQEGYTYTLTFNVGRRANMSSRGNDYVASLLAGATTLVSTNGAAAQNDFSEAVSVVFTPDASHAALIGQTLAIQFAIDTDYQPHFDNVMLVAMPPQNGIIFVIR